MNKKIVIEIDDKDIKVRGESFRPGHAHRDKTKYSRKIKHKGKEEDSRCTGG